MNIYYIREFWFDDFYEGNGNVQRAFTGRISISKT